MFSKWTSFTQPQKTFLLGWATFLIVLSGATLFFAGGQQHQYLKDSINRHAVRVGPSGNEKGQTDAEKSPPPGRESDVPKEVRVGVYVDRIPQLSIIGSAWKADFYLWFDWEGADLNPGETFHIVSGEILSKTVLEKKTIGKRQYALYRVTGGNHQNF